MRSLRVRHNEIFEIKNRIVERERKSYSGIDNKI